MNAPIKTKEFKKDIKTFFIGQDFKLCKYFLTNKINLYYKPYKDYFFYICVFYEADRYVNIWIGCSKLFLHNFTFVQTAPIHKVNTLFGEYQELNIPFEHPEIDLHEYGSDILLEKIKNRLELVTVSFADYAISTIENDRLSQKRYKYFFELVEAYKREEEKIRNSTDKEYFDFMLDTYPDLHKNDIEALKNCDDFNQLKAELGGFSEFLYPKSFFKETKHTVEELYRIINYFIFRISSTKSDPELNYIFGIVKNNALSWGSDLDYAFSIFMTYIEKFYEK